MRSFLSRWRTASTKANIRPIGLVSYAFEGAMWDIIEGDAMNVEDASSAFEEYLKNYLAQQAAE